MDRCLISPNRLEPYARALVVDDVALNRRLMRGILEKEALEVDEAECATSALEALERRRYDVVLLDVELDENGSGYDVLEAIRARPRFDSTPVLVVTGTACDADSVARGLLAGAQDYITKPFNPVVLAARVKAACRTRSAFLTLQHDARVAQSRTEQIFSEVENAGAVQRATLPEVPFQTTGLCISGGLVPAGSVSGDTFDIVQDASGRVSVVLLDAAGHGPTSGLILASARSAVRRAIMHGEPLDEVVQDMHETLAAQGGVLEASAALGILRFSPGRRTVEVLNASLPAIISVGAFGETTCYRSMSAPIDARDLPHRYELVEAEWDTVWMMCSDGATAGSFEDDDVMSLARRIGVYRFGTKLASARPELLRNLMNEGGDWTRMQSIDDATLVVVGVSREGIW